MNEITNIAAAFEPTKVEAAGWFEGRVRKQFAKLAESYGDGEKIKLFARVPAANQATFALVRSCCAVVDADGNPVVSGSGRDFYVIDEARLAKKAAEFGEDQVAGFVAKLEKKLGDLTAVELIRAGNGEFVIAGKLGDRAVRVDQQVVFKVSSKGTFFLQWPARIYVEGKFTPEKAFKELAAEVRK
jgi:hypothetical protein